MQDETASTAPETQLDTPAVVQLLGHHRIAGHLRTVSLAGKSFFQLSIPAHNSRPAHTRFISPSAVYDIQPVDEAAMLAVLPTCNDSPVNAILMDHFRQEFARRSTPAPAITSGDTDNDDDPFEEPFGF